MQLTDDQIRKLIPYIIEATRLKPFQVEHTVKLLQEGATVPFIDLYRKEHTGESGYLRNVSAIWVDVPIAYDKAP